MIRKNLIILADNETPKSHNTNYIRSNENFIDLYGRAVSIIDFGAKCDLIEATCSVSSGSAVILGHTFVADDIGKKITVYGAGSVVLPPTATASVIGTTGTTQYQYVLTSCTLAGESVASSVITVSNGNSTLSESSFIKITVSPVANALFYNLYRVVGGLYYKVNDGPIKRQLYYSDYKGTYSASASTLASATSYKHITGSISSVSGGNATISVNAARTASGLSFIFGTDDTAAINSALNSGSNLITTPLSGGSMVTDSIVLQSNSHFRLSPNFKIHKLEDIGGWILSNRATLDVDKALTNCNISANSYTLTSAGGFSDSDVGKTIVLHRAGPNYFAITGNAQSLASTNLVSTIVSVVGANQAILKHKAFTAVSGGTVNVYVRDKDIELSGGTLSVGYSYTNPAITMELICTQAGRNISFLRRVDGLKIHDTKVLSYYGKYAVFLADVTDYNVHDVNLDVNADGIHVTGPAENGSVRRISGFVGDDGATAHASDWDLCDCDVQGDITSYSIDDIHISTPNSIVRLHGAQGYKINANISKLSGSGHSALFADDVTEGAGDINFTLDGVYVKQDIPGYSLIALSTGNGGIGVTKNVRIHPESLRSNLYTSYGKWKMLDLDLKAVEAKATAAIFLNNATIGKLILNMTWNGIIPGDLPNGIYFSGTTAINDVVFNQLSAGGFIHFISSGPNCSIKRFIFNGLKIENFAGCLGVFQSSTLVVLNDLYVTGSGYPTLFAPSGASTVLSIQGSGVIRDNTGGGFNVVGTLSGGTKVRCYNHDLPGIGSVAATIGTASFASNSNDNRGKVSLSSVTGSSVVTITLKSDFAGNVAPLVAPLDASGVGLYVSSRSTSSFAVTVPTGCTGFSYKTNPLDY